MGPAELEARARRWRWSAHAVICDSVEHWTHGTVARASRYPDYYDFNLVRVEDDLGMDFQSLVEFTDQALAGLAHRMICFDRIAAADRVRGDFAAHGWKTMRVLWMHFEGDRPTDGLNVQQVPYESVHHLRVAWHAEDFPDTPESADFYRQAREVSSARGVEVLAVAAEDDLMGFAQLERDGPAAEITQVYVSPEHRGAGLGTALTSAAIREAGDAGDLWICADDEDRPKELYERLGFRPAWVAMDCLRLPSR
jgi:GNAT superfamily N-acetyltransferase